MLTAISIVSGTILIFAILTGMMAIILVKIISWNMRITDENEELKRQIRMLKGGKDEI